APDRGGSEGAHRPGAAEILVGSAQELDRPAAQLARTGVLVGTDLIEHAHRFDARATSSNGAGGGETVGHDDRPFWRWCARTGAMWLRAGAPVRWRGGTGTR